MRTGRLDEFNERGAELIGADSADADAEILLTANEAVKELGIKEYMRGNKVFADAFNYLIYDGEQVVKPALLQELDTTEIAIPFALDENESPTEDVVQKYRDVLKSTVIMQDSRASYILLGVENQTEIHYAMPVRNIIYDALQYGKQVSEVAKSAYRQTSIFITKFVIAKSFSSDITGRTA